MSAASRTAEIAAAMRASAHAESPGRRLFDDPHARWFVRTPWLRWTLRSKVLTRAVRGAFDGAMPGILSEALVRCRFAEEALRNALRDGVDQVVILGAGYDTTCLRVPLDDGITLFEIDHPDTQAVKIEIMRQRAPEVARLVRYVPCDFEREDLLEQVTRAGLDGTRPSFVSWLAVTMYLGARAVSETLRTLSGFMPPGSRLVLDYMHADVIDGTTPHRGARRAARAVARRGEPYVFGWAPHEVPVALSAAGFAVVEHLSAEEALRRAGVSSGLAPAPFMGLVSAERRSES